jgi:hypothetical protein
MNVDQDLWATTEKQKCRSVCHVQVRWRLYIKWSKTLLLPFRKPFSTADETKGLLITSSEWAIEPPQQPRKKADLKVFTKWREEGNASTCSIYSWTLEKGEKEEDRAAATQISQKLISQKPTLSLKKDKPFPWQQDGAKTPKNCSEKALLGFRRIEQTLNPGFEKLMGSTIPLRPISRRGQTRRSAGTIKCE